MAAHEQAAPRLLREVGALLRALADRTVHAHLGLAVLLVGAGGLLAALAPLALTAMVDAVARASRGSAESIDGALLLPAAAYVLALGTGRTLAAIGPLLCGTAEQRLTRNLTRHAFGHVIGLPMDYLLRRRGGELVQCIELARAGCQIVTGHVVNSIVPVLVEAVTIGIVLATLDQPALLATFTVTACAYLAIFGAGSIQVRRLADGVSSAHLQHHAHLGDSLLHAETLRCFVAEDAASRRVDALGTELERRWLRLNRLRAAIGVGVALVFTTSLAASLLLAGQAVLEGSLSAGGFVLANLYMLQMVRPLEMLGSAVRDVAQALGFLQPLLDVLRTPTEETTRGHGTVSPRPSLVFDSVRFGYDSRLPVLQGFDLEIGPGRTVGIVGASGSGKSSLVRLLLGLYQPQSGRILIDGRPIDTLPAAGLRAGIGLVPQDTALLHDTIARNISLGRPTASRDDIERAARHAQLHDFIAGLPDGYDTVVGERGLQLSGGERQRIAIARALLKRPGIFVFDEATSMLDSHTEAAILGKLRDVTAGCATIVIAHRLSTVVHADEIVVLDAGRVVERGPHALLLAKSGHYARLWRLQASGAR